MKLRTIRRQVQTHLESTWVKFRSQFIDVEQLAKRVPESFSIGLVLLEDTPDARTLDSAKTQLYRAAGIHTLADSNWKDALSAAACQHDYIGLINPTVALQADALLWAAIELCRSEENPQWVYFDHACPERQQAFRVVAKDGTRYRGDVPNADDSNHQLTPVFKPEFSPEHLLTGSFTGGFNLFSSAAINSVLSTLPEAECDLRNLQFEIGLRLVEQEPHLKVHRIPQIAFVDPTVATAQLLESQRLAVEKHLDRRGIPAVVNVACEHPPILSPFFSERTDATVTVLIPTRNQFERVQKCVEDVRATTCENVHIRMIDNQSDDENLFSFYETQQRLGRFSVEHFDEPFNYARMHNVTIERLDSEFVILLNNDVFDFSDGWTDQLVGTARLSEDIGCVGALLRYPDGMTQHGGVSFGIGRPCRHIHLGMPADAPGYCGRLQSLQQLSALTAALLLIRRDVYQRLGGFDEVRFPVSYNDTDLCLRMRSAGYRAIYNPRVTAIHEESVSRGRSPLERKWRNEFMQLWKGEIESDPFYSPHLSHREYAVENVAFRAWQQRKQVSIKAMIDAA